MSKTSLFLKTKRYNTNIDEQGGYLTPPEYGGFYIIDDILTPYNEWSVCLRNEDEMITAGCNLDEITLACNDEYCESYIELITSNQNVVDAVEADADYPVIKKTEAE